MDLFPRSLGVGVSRLYGAGICRPDSGRSDRLWDLERSDTKSTRAETEAWMGRPFSGQKHIPLEKWSTENCKWKTKGGVIQI